MSFFSKLKYFFKYSMGWKHLNLIVKSRDNLKQDGKSLLTIHEMPCHPSFWKHNSLLSCRSKSTSVDLDPCVPLSLPINKLEMSYVWEKNSLFVLLQAAKHTKNSKCTQQRGLFLMEIDTKGQLLTKLQKSKHFKAEFVMTEFMGSKVEFMLHCILTKVSKAPDTLQLFFWRKKS